jgi:anti-anti-sigma factor
MDLQIESRTEKGVMVVEPRGHLTLGNGTLLHREVKRMVENGAQCVLVDLSGVSYVDSHGLGQMVACHNTLRRSGGQLRFAGVSQKLSALLDMTGLPCVLQVDRDLATGLSKLGNA